MDRVILLPRLDAHGGEQLIAAFPEDALPRSGIDVPSKDLAALVSFGASGGTRSPDAALRIGADLIQLAEQYGFPKQTDQNAKGRFDHKVAVYLSTHPLLQSGEALRDDVWAYMATALVPDLVAWRFPNRAPARYRGGVRNALQRLWMRGHVLDRGEHHPNRWELLDSLGEDAVVAIIERPSLRNMQLVAHALAEGWLRMSRQNAQGVWEDLMRTATKLLRLRNQVVDLSCLGIGQLEEEVNKAFDDARRTIGAGRLS